jgi:hypothetical protein
LFVRSRSAAQDVVDGEGYTAQRLLLGTQADAGEQNYLLLAQAKVRATLPRVARSPSRLRDVRAR